MQIVNIIRITIALQFMCYRCNHQPRIHVSYSRLSCTVYHKVVKDSFSFTCPFNVKDVFIRSVILDLPQLFGWFCCWLMIVCLKVYSYILGKCLHSIVTQMKCGKVEPYVYNFWNMWGNTTHIALDFFLVVDGKAKNWSTNQSFIREWPLLWRNLKHKLK